MSIIYDYLKQIHDQKETKGAVPEIPPVKKSWEPFFGMKASVTILGCLLLAAGLYFFLPITGKTTARLYPEPEKAQAVQPETPDFNFLLEGIIYNPSRPFAIINGKMLEAGGRVGDFEVVQITPDTVSLKNLKDNTSRTVRL